MYILDKKIGGSSVPLDEDEFYNAQAFWAQRRVEAMTEPQFKKWLLSLLQEEGEGVFEEEKKRIEKEMEERPNDFEEDFFFKLDWFFNELADSFGYLKTPFIDK